MKPTRASANRGARQSRRCPTTRRNRHIPGDDGVVPCKIWEYPLPRAAVARRTVKHDQRRPGAHAGVGDPYPVDIEVVHVRICRRTEWSVGCDISRLRAPAPLPRRSDWQRARSTVPVRVENSEQRTVMRPRRTIPICRYRAPCQIREAHRTRSPNRRCRCPSRLATWLVVRSIRRPALAHSGVVASWQTLASSTSQRSRCQESRTPTAWPSWHRSARRPDRPIAWRAPGSTSRLGTAGRIGYVRQPPARPRDSSKGEASRSCCWAPTTASQPGTGGSSSPRSIGLMSTEHLHE